MFTLVKVPNFNQRGIEPELKMESMGRVNAHQAYAGIPVYHQAKTENQASRSQTVYWHGLGHPRPTMDDGCTLQNSEGHIHRANFQLKFSNCAS